MKSLLAFALIVFPFFMISCGSATAPTTYSIGGSVSGLAGTGLVLQDNGGDNLTIAQNGSFTFPTALVSGASYAVTVLTQPTNPVQTCTVTYGGTGMATANVVIAQITCTTNTLTVGGNVSGLAGSGLVLQNNGGNNLTVNANGSFTFTTAVNRGSNYNVTVLTQPSSPTQTCAITNGFGANVTGNVTAVQVNCFTTSVTYTIGGTVSGLSGTGLVLQDNSGDNLSIAKNGSFTFPTALPSGSTFSVTVFAQPASPAQICTVAGGGGTATANITGVLVNCTTTAITAGVAHTCAVTGTGGVLCWGSNEFGQLGNGETASSTSPVEVTGLRASVISVAAGANSTCALTDLGTVWCWGDNSSGQLGDGTLAQSSAPVEVKDSIGRGTLVDIARIAAGGSHACAVTTAGTAFCWGNNSSGELGSGTETFSTLPVAVSGLSGGVAAIAAGSDFTCAVTSSREAECWGDGAAGRLGNGTSAGGASPLAVTDASGSSPLSGVATISAGVEGACALTEGGNVFCWGANGSGQLGDGAVSASSATPVEVLDSAGTSPLADIVAISSGLDSSCAETASGAMQCWGANGSGQLGNGGGANSSTPVAVAGLASGAVAIAAGEQHTCTVTSSGIAQCWGANAGGQLANGTSRSSAIPMEAVGVNHVGLLRLF